MQPPGILPLGDLNTQSAHDPATPLLISYPKLLKAPRLTAALLTAARGGNDLTAHQQVNGFTVHDISVSWNIISL